MQDTLDILCSYEYDDYVEHHGVPGMRWGHRKQKLPSYSSNRLNKLKNKFSNKINNLEDKQYKLAKPYADSSGHFKINDPKKAAKHLKYSEKIVTEKNKIKDIDDVLNKRNTAPKTKKVNTNETFMKRNFPTADKAIQEVNQWVANTFPTLSYLNARETAMLKEYMPKVYGLGKNVGSIRSVNIPMSKVSKSVADSSLFKIHEDAVRVVLKTESTLLKDIVK